MSHSNYVFPAASPEFIALCKSQTFLVNQGLGAIWSAVYLTKEFADERQKQLIPLVSNPQSSNFLQHNVPVSRLPEVFLEKEFPISLPSVNSGDGRMDSSHSKARKRTKKDNSQEIRRISKQIVLPLVYEETVMGFLIAIREDRQWEERELKQIEHIAKTLAIACCLDRKQLWYRQQLNDRESLTTIEHDRLDNFIHQLRNPITALRTFSKLLLKRIAPGDRERSIAQSMLRESDRISELIQQFTDNLEPIDAEIKAIEDNTPSLALPEAQKSTTSNFLLPSNSLGQEYLSVVEILTPLLESFEAIASEKQIELSDRLPANLPLVRANAKALREVLSNLIDNAIKYTPSKGKVEIIAGIEGCDSNVNYQGISISDAGYGIPSEDQKHLFERHYRGVQAEGDIPGTGLGLAIAKELIEKMEGKIELISPNHFQNASLLGTTFIVWLLAEGVGSRESGVGNRV
jgi:signal transduction histidine kinase